MNNLDELLVQLKERLHISHGSEDENLKRILSSSIANLTGRCGEFDIYTNERAKELVFERVRYVYNDSVEFFDKNFLSEINSLGISLLPEVAEEGETV